MNKLVEMTELVLAAEQILEDMKAIRDKSEEPKLYDGLTENQWQIVIDEKLVCCFWDDDTKDLHLGRLTDTQRYGFQRSDGTSWKHCELHPLMPQFCNGTKPDGLDDDDMVVIHYIPTRNFYRAAIEVDWSTVERWQRVNL